MTAIGTWFAVSKPPSPGFDSSMQCRQLGYLHKRYLNEFILDYLQEQIVFGVFEDSEKPLLERIKLDNQFEVERFYAGVLHHVGTSLIFHCELAKNACFYHRNSDYTAELKQFGTMILDRAKNFSEGYKDDFSVKITDNRQYFFENLFSRIEHVNSDAEEILSKEVSLEHIKKMRDAIFEYIAAGLSA